jgi:hypothetical protein
MSRAYNTSTVAAALQCSSKWLDNLLSHHSVAGVEHTRQGVARRISHEAVLVIHIAKTLVDQLNLPLGAALPIAEQMASGGPLRLAEGISLQLERPRAEQELAELLFNGVQAAPPKRRGRPPKRAK